MGAALGLGGFALFGWLTGRVFRGLLRDHRFGIGRFFLLLALLKGVAFVGFMLSVAVYTVGPEEIPSDVERTVLKLGVWPVFAVLAIWAYWRRVRTRMISRRVVSPPGVFLARPPLSDALSISAREPSLVPVLPLAPPPPPAPLPQPF